MAITKNTRIRQIMEEFLSIGNVSDDLLGEFRGWLLGNGHLKEKSNAFRELMSEKISFDPNPGKDVYRSYHKVAARLGFEKEIVKKAGKYRPLGSNVALRVAAVLLPIVIVFGATLLIWNRTAPVEETPAVAEIYLSAPEGEKKHTTLPDNSSVWLNSDSELVYEDGFATERTVKLEGEGFFKVAKAEGHSFRVATEDLTVTVLGTVFNIENSRDDGITTVSLYEGELEVTVPGNSYLMTHGHELEYNSLTGETSLREMSRTKPEWMRNIIDYNQVPATEVLNSIGRIYGYNIYVSSPELAGDIVTLKFEGEISFEAVLSIMSELSGFNYRIRGSDVYIKAK